MASKVKTRSMKHKSNEEDEYYDNEGDYNEEQLLKKQEGEEDTEESGAEEIEKIGG